MFSQACVWRINDAGPVALTLKSGEGGPQQGEGVFVAAPDEQRGHGEASLPTATTCYELVGLGCAGAGCRNSDPGGTHFAAHRGRRRSRPGAEDDR